MGSDASSSSRGDGSPTPPPNSKPYKATVKSTTESGVPQKVTKRRAARACVSCRARKVRCDVVEGAPCGNCRWDNVECIVQESRRRKKQQLATANAVGQSAPTEAPIQSKANNSSNATNSPVNGTVGANALSTDPRRASSGSVLSPTTATGPDGLPALLPNCVDNSHVPHMIYQRSGFSRDSALSTSGGAVGAPDLTSANLNANATVSPNGSAARNNSVPWVDTTVNPNRLFGDSRTVQFLNSLDDHDASAQLPPFIRPLPTKIVSDDVSYLRTKGALTLPSVALQNALLQAFVEYVHPYMPLLDIHPFLSIVHNRDGFNGQTSLLLYHAVMFSGVAFVDAQHLREAGYSTRKAARKAFFQKTRLLYDFDYESDRLILVQSLLCMTYWYETPDDQKDTWHWMGVAISLAHTIGLHRNPGTTGMPPAKQKLWKRIWWSCFMRDRLIALGMRRPTRIKDEDFDVPMLVESDFEIQTLSESNTTIPPECTFMRDTTMQRELARMCIAKAELCLCISQMLKTQYSVLIRDPMKPENTTSSTMMLFPNKDLDNATAVDAVDASLKAWSESLPSVCRYRPINKSEIQNGRATLAVQRTLLHMAYQTTVSALHRPQFLPSSPMQPPTASRQVQDHSRGKVRNAAMQITRMANDLHHYRLDRYLPTTGVTVILPAMIIHLLEMKSPSEDARQRATHGFRRCMRTMERLREMYSAADYATVFLDAALRKAAIDINSSGAATATTTQTNGLSGMKGAAMPFTHTPPPEPTMPISGTDAMINGKSMVPPPNTINGASLDLSANSPPHTEFDTNHLTPSASGGSDQTPTGTDLMDLDLGNGVGEFDWDAVGGSDFDVDQFLQYPAEGVTNVEEDLMAGVMGGDEPDAKTVSWAPELNGEDVNMELLANA